MSRITFSENIFPFAKYICSHGYMRGDGRVVFHLTLSDKVTLKISGDLKIVTAFTALYLRQYLTNGFELRDHNHKI